MTFRSSMHKPHQDTFKFKDSLNLYVKYHGHLEVKDLSPMALDKVLYEVVYSFYPLIEMVINKEFFGYTYEVKEDLFMWGVYEVTRHVNRKSFSIPEDLEVAWHFTRWWYTTVKRRLIKGAQSLVEVGTMAQITDKCYKRYAVNNFDLLETMYDFELFSEQVYSEFNEKYRFSINLKPMFLKMADYVFTNYKWIKDVSNYREGYKNSEVQLNLRYLKVLTRIKMKSRKKLYSIILDIDDLGTSRDSDASASHYSMSEAEEKMASSVVHSEVKSYNAYSKDENGKIIIPAKKVKKEEKMGYFF